MTHFAWIAANDGIAFMRQTKLMYLVDSSEIYQCPFDAPRNCIAVTLDCLQNRTIAFEATEFDINENNNKGKGYAHHSPRWEYELYSIELAWVDYIVVLIRVAQIHFECQVLTLQWGFDFRSYVEAIKFENKLEVVKGFEDKKPNQTKPYQFVLRNWGCK